MTAVTDLVVSVVNHLLGTEDWARQRLAPFAGQAFRIEGGPLRLELSIADEGWIAAAELAEAPLVEIRFTQEALTEILADPAKAFSAAQLSGSAQFAEALAFVFRNLRWDYEADLARLFGDIAAHRLAGVLRDGLSWQRETLARLGSNAAEFATEEAAIVTPRRDVSRFGADVDALRDDLARLEKRIARLAAQS
jgi:ubiquinone biosynthesis protein UbiJ